MIIFYVHYLWLGSKNSYWRNHFLSLCRHNYALLNLCLYVRFMQMAFIFTAMLLSNFLLPTFPLGVSPAVIYFCFIPKSTPIISVSVFKSSVMSSFFETVVNCRSIDDILCDTILFVSYRVYTIFLSVSSHLS